jgi:hypothetical protein
MDPVVMMVNSNEPCASDFDRREVIPLQLESVTCGVRLLPGRRLVVVSLCTSVSMVAYDTVTSNCFNIGGGWGGIGIIVLGGAW